MSNVVTRGSVQLVRWMVQNQISQTALGERLGIGQSVVAHYLRGGYTPSRVRANQFAALTGGAVPTAAWDVLASADDLRVHAEAMAAIRHAGSGDHQWARRAPRQARGSKKRARSKGRAGRAA
jgi:transcriptional regulator with XRE-family HTH domain